MSQLPIRPVSNDEYESLRRILHFVFNEAPDDETGEREREFLELDRTLAAFDGKGVIASAAAYSFDMTIPGGSVPAAGVSWVGVLPTHRRRGVLSSLMRRQLDDIRAAGREPIAALWASEPAIYGRFGYGMASQTLSLTLPRRSKLRAVPGSADLRARLVEPEESVPIALPVYDHDRGRRPGMFAMTEVLQRLRIYLPPHARDGMSPLRTVLIEDDADVRAYARYTVKAEWNAGGPDSTVSIREVHGVDSAAVAAVWAFLLDIDLTARAEVRLRPPDDPLVGMLVDFRRATAALGDGLYVRLIDVGAALSARTYTVPVDVVLDVRDDFCPWNSGRWRLSGDATGGRCERTGDPAHVSLDVRELGATYLGGTSLHALGDSGLVTEHSPGAVRELSTALRHEPAPWCPLIF